MRLAEHLAAHRGGTAAAWSTWLRAVGLSGQVEEAHLSAGQRTRLLEALRLRSEPGTVAQPTSAPPSTLAEWARQSLLDWLQLSRPWVLSGAAEAQPQLSQWSQALGGAEPRAARQAVPLPHDEPLLRDPAVTRPTTAGALRVWLLLNAAARDLRLRAVLAQLCPSPVPRALPVQAALAIAAPGHAPGEPLMGPLLEVLPARSGQLVRLRRAQVEDNRRQVMPLAPAAQVTGLLARVAPLPTGRIPLQLPESTLSSLRDIALRWRHRRAVASAGGQNGVIALLAGPQGHGRRTAARELAEQLQLPLLRVTGALLGSRWIGETEQRVSQMFAAAHKAGAALLVEDAQDLLGPRVAVQSAGDRYANTTRNHLLQEIEQFSGLVLLVAQGPHRFDPAMQRRIHVIVHFVPPDRSWRARILQAAWTWVGERDAALTRDEPDFAALAAADATPQQLVQAVLGAALTARMERSSLDQAALAASLGRHLERSAGLMQQAIDLQ